MGRQTATGGEPRFDDRRGRGGFLQNACVNCHTIAGTSAAGRFGPDLTHLASRDTIASGAVRNTPENLRKWIDNPDPMKPGCLMPSMHLNDHDLNAVTGYLTTLTDMADSFRSPTPSISRRKRILFGLRRYMRGSPRSTTRKSV